MDKKCLPLGEPLASTRSAAAYAVASGVGGAADGAGGGTIDGSGSRKPSMNERRSTGGQ